MSIMAHHPDEPLGEFVHRWWSSSRHLKVHQRDKDPTDTVESAWQLFFKEVDDDDDENDDYADVDDDDVPR